ncbi:hypothetical protein [Paractinoplanes toevensis]|uniref:Uncharacterized protein n=1 Tax=Paractinoplanes toevensis TaxID=571911 RepID=A0A919WCW1_9ACTN|nr:hypothetical protein [Actinoplanes toevensis]GIM97836.1 hypothetical protein Ato02nite_096290 [Actinoplanes toevensis]
MIDDRLVRAGGWLLLTIGAMSLWRGIDLLRRGEPDAAGLPARWVLAQGAGLTLLGAGNSLRGPWVYLFLPALALLLTGEVYRLTRFLNDRRAKKQDTPPA